jgi:phenylacetate-CoA ligase
LKILGYNFFKAQKNINDYKLLSKDESAEWQKKIKWKIAFFHFTHNKEYRNKVGPIFPDKWEDLPVMEKKDYQNSWDNILTKGYSEKNLYIANTSGSTGTPFFYAKNKFSHSMTWALTADRYGWYNLGLRSKEARFYGRSLKIMTKIQEKIKDLLMNRTLFNVFDLSDDSCEKYLRLFFKKKIKYIYGYTNSLILFANFLKRKDINLKSICSSLSLCITTSEMLLNQDRETLLNAFGVPIINEYGVSEAGGIVAFENKNNIWELSNETQFIEMIDKQGNILPHEVDGEILITDLYNKAMPFIRYKVGDIGRLSVENDKVYLEKLIGRTNDTILLSNGKISPGLTFYYISRSLLESTGIIKEFIIRQTEIDTFVFDIIMDRDFEITEIELLEQSLKKHLKSNLRLIINRVNKIKRPVSGKIKHFYSEIHEC